MSTISSDEETMDINSFVEDMVKKMTLDEKFLLLANRTRDVYFSSTPIYRLGLPINRDD